MIHLLLLASLTAAPPAWLTEPNPGSLLRWRTLPLAVSNPTAGRAPTATFSVVGPALVRVRGDFSEGCEPRILRRFGAAGRSLEVPLALSADGPDRLLELSPAIAPGIGDEQREPAAEYLLATELSCRHPLPQLFHAALEPDEYGPVRIALEARRALRQPVGSEEVLTWLAAPHARDWQAQLALARALPMLLERLPGKPEAGGELALAWAERAIAQMRLEDLSYLRRQKLEAELERVSPQGDREQYLQLPKGRELTGAAQEAEVLRLFVRAAWEPGLEGVAGFRLEIRFDDCLPLVIANAAGSDPEVPSASRLRTLSIPVPPGARSFSIRSLDRALLVRGYLGRHSAHLEDSLSALSEAAHLRRALAVAAADQRGRFVAALARGLLGEAAGASEAAMLSSGDPLLGALAGLAGAELIADPALAKLALDRVDSQLAAGKSELEVAAARLLSARALRLRARLEAAQGRWRDAFDLFAAAARTRPLTTDEAIELASFEAWAPEGLDGGAPGLAILDGLLARRPLDRELMVARSRLFSLASGWRSLTTDASVREVAFLAPPETQSPGARADAGSFARLPQDGQPLKVELHPALWPGRVPVLSLLSVRAGVLARTASVLVDQTPVSIPVISALERFDLPLPAGTHSVALASKDLAGEIWVADVGSPDQQRLRRFAQLGPEGLVFHSREVGIPAVLQVSVRVAVAPGAPVPPRFGIILEGMGEKPLRLEVEPGSPATQPRSEIGADSLATEVVEATLPVAAMKATLQVRSDAPAPATVLVRLAVRRQHPAIPSEIDPDAVGIAAGEAEAPKALAAVQRGSEQLAKSPKDASLLLARAAALVELDELALAREDLLAAMETEGLGPHRRAFLASLWRGIDEVAGVSPSSLPAGMVSPSASLALGAGRPESLGVGLLGLLDDRAALASSGPAQLKSRAGEGAAGDLALLLAARQAESEQNLPRAAALWRELALGHPASAVVRREAGAALLRTGSAADAAQAYLELLAATRLEPRDSRAHRLLRQAAGRTRLRPLRFAEESAGSVGVLVKGSEPLEPTVEDALLPLQDDAARATLLTRGRQASFSFSLNAPMAVALRAQALELRGREAGLLPGTQPLAIEWRRDGEPPQRLECSAQECQGAPISLAAGQHTLAVALVGGLRPAARLWLSAERGAEDAPHLSEHLLARADAPVALAVHGPALLRVEARARLDRRGAREALVVARAASLPNEEVVVPLAEKADGRAALPDGGATTAPAVALIALEHDVLYRVEIRPKAGEALVRLFAREALDSPPSEPPPPLAFRSLGAAPRLAPATLELPAALHVEEGQVAPGYDELGSLTGSLRVQHRTTNAVGVTEQTNNAVFAGLAYRRLLEPWHLTLKGVAEHRQRFVGSSAEWLGGEAFYMHPEWRALRAQLTLDGYTQVVDGQRAFSGQLAGMLEPVMTLVPGLHLVTKLGAWNGAYSLSHVEVSKLLEVDPNVYSRYDVSHRRGLFWEEGLETEPFTNVVLYANARLTTNASFSPLDQDHLSTTAIARALLGRTYVEVAARGSAFFVDADRPDPVLYKTLFLSAFHTLWLDERQHLEVGFWTAFHFDGNFPEVMVHLSWNGSNGRRFLDHTPLEGEDFFFPQRGPSGERGHLEVLAP